MSDGEFEVIDRYFSQIGWQNSSSLILGPGDDCAVLSVPADEQLCVSTDTLLETVHFPRDCAGAIVAQRCFAAAFSDLAAMGAMPLGFTVALTMTGVDHTWLSGFSETLSRLSIQYEIPLVGGNLANGPLSVTLTVMGTTPTGQAIYRHGAQVGDVVYVTGHPGCAGAGLRYLDQAADHYQSLIQAYTAPTPRIDIGIGLRGLATAGIDISDGLLADLGHIAARSQVCLQLEQDAIPLSDSLLQCAGPELAMQLALTAGDDYELCFTAALTTKTAIRQLAERSGIEITPIGRVVEGQGIGWSGEAPAIEMAGYQHFSS